MKKSIVDKRAQATKLAKATGLLGFWGKPTDEYRSLIMKVTGKDRMAIMTPDEADRFLEALESLLKARQGQPSSWLNDPWSRAWTWIVVFVLIVAFLFLIDQIDGTEAGYSDITWAPGATAVLFFNMVSAAFIRPYVKRHGRNVVRWITAFVVFTPVLAGIAYLLTWPKNQRQKGD